MDFPISLFAVSIVVYAAHMISSNAIRIQKKFDLNDQAVRLDDLTKYPNISNNSNMIAMQLGGSSLDSSTVAQRHRKSLNEV